ncbi:hypothetical protein [Kribbia dieselivorans]|nr:hypothetical protein [Kribbia dieselivorans]
MEPGPQCPTSDAGIPTYGGSGLQPGVDLEDKAALADLLDAEDETPTAG